MKMKSLILLFLAISLSFTADYSFLIVPRVSSVNISVSPTSVQGPTVSEVGAVQSFPHNINITGNLKVSGNSTVNFSGPSPDLPVTVYLNGSIDVVDNGTLVLRYVTLFFVGAKKPYDRYIRLSNSTNGHPRLIIVGSTIDALTSANIVVTRTGTRTQNDTVSYGCAIYAYNNSEISGQQFSIYRDIVSTKNYSAGGPTVIKCYGESSVNLTSCAVDSVLTYDEARVSIFTGGGPNLIGKSSAPDVGVGFVCRNNSIVNLDTVTFKNITAYDESHLLLTHCKELTHGFITTKGQSRVDCSVGTTLANSQSGSVFFPAINASDYSYVSLSSSTISTTGVTNPVVSLHGHATFNVVKGGIISGVLLAFDYSRIVLNNSKTANGLINLSIVGRNFSSVSISNSSLSSFPNPIQISLFDGSSLSVVNSTILGGWIQFFNNTAVFISYSRLTSSSVAGGYGTRIISQGNSNVTVVGSSITATPFEMRDNARVSVESSTASLIYCRDSSQVSLVSASISELSLGDSTRVHAANSTLNELSFADSNVTGSLTGLTSLFENLTFALSGGSAQASLLNTTVNSLDFIFSGHSNVTISNSTISNLGLQDSSFARLSNTTIQGSVYAVGNSRVFVYSPLRVRCVDYFGNPLNGSVVSVGSGYGGGNALGQQTADKNGWVSFVLFAELDNATGSFPFGIATVSGVFGGVSVSQRVSVGLINKDLTLSFPLPSWSQYILPVVILVAIVVLLILTYFVLKRVRGKTE